MSLHLDLLIPALLWPFEDAAEVMRAVQAPVLERWLAHGRPVPASVAGTWASGDAWLWRAMTLPDSGNGSRDSLSSTAGTDLPLAPVTLLADGGVPGTRWWMRADPVHFIVGRTGLRLAPLDTLRLREDEAIALATTVGAHFAGTPFTLDTPGPQRWYVASDTPFELASCPPVLAVGDDIARHLPTGPHRLEWLRVMNEVQMLWFEHPVNLARERRGEPVASSLWWHGPGRLPPPGKPEYSDTAGDGALLAGLAALNGLPCFPLPEDARHWLTLARPSDASDTVRPRHWLLAFDMLSGCARAGDAIGWREALAAFDRDWCAPLDAALRAGHLAGVALHHPGPARPLSMRIMRGDRLRIWRRSRPLASHA